MGIKSAARRSRPEMILSVAVLIVTAVLIPIIYQTIIVVDTGSTVFFTIIVAVLFVATLWYSMQYMLLVMLKYAVKREWEKLEISLARRHAFATTLAQEWSSTLPSSAAMVGDIAEITAKATNAATKAGKLTNEAILGDKLRPFIEQLAKLPEAGECSPIMQSVIPAIRNIHDIGREIYVQQASYDSTVIILNDAIRGTRWSALPFIMAIMEEEMAGELV
ncbi:MAG: hypothetical protein WCJ56_02605 [bacterium]